MFAEEKLTSNDYRNLVRYAMAQYLKAPKYYVDQFSSLAPQMEKVMHETGEQAGKSFEGQSWVTSDNPVTLLRYKSKDSYDFKGAWAQKSVDIFMPISPQYLLYTAVGKKQAVESSERLQTLINKMIIENAFLQVYSTAPDLNIPKIRPRVVDEAEYKRIQEMLKSWHEVQTEGERKFFDNKNFG